MSGDSSRNQGDRSQNNEDGAELKSPGKIVGGIKEICLGLRDAPVEVYNWSRANRFQALMLAVGLAALGLEISSRISTGPLEIIPVLNALTPQLTNGQLFLALIGTVVVETYVIKAKIETIAAREDHGDH